MSGGRVEEWNTCKQGSMLLTVTTVDGATEQLTLHSVDNTLGFRKLPNNCI